jgi:hypothetical protein
LQDRYRHFLARAVEKKTVWVLLSPKGKGATFESLYRDAPDGQPAAVELAFSLEALARAQAKVEGYETFVPRALALELYLGILDGGDFPLICPDPFHGGAVEVEAFALAAALRAVSRGDDPNRAHLTDDDGVRSIPPMR